VPAAAFDIRLSRSNDEAVVTPTGDLDMRLADHLEAQVIRALAGDPALLTIDLAEVPFCDSAGINALVRIHHVCARRRVSLRLTALAPQVRTVLRVTGVQGLLNVPDDEEDV
jgi:anti-sigma B factor antagonist